MTMKRKWMTARCTPVAHMFAPASGFAVTLCGHWRADETTAQEWREVPVEYSRCAYCRAAEVLLGRVSA
jgi:hypothetical protein